MGKSILISMKNLFLDLFGFRKNSKYVKKYFNEANMRSTIYMSAVIVILEIWLVARNTSKYVIGKDALKPDFNWFLSMYNRTGTFWLFMIAGFTMLVFSIFYLKDKHKPTKAGNILCNTTAIVLIVYSIYFLVMYGSLKKFSFANSISNVTSVCILILSLSALFVGITSIIHNIYKNKHNENSIIISVFLVVFFSIMCLVFGIYVSYSDFFGNWVNGLPAYYESTNSYADVKSIICFLTMVIYVACLLIWKPYISLVTLITVFLSFYYLVSGQPNVRLFPDGEKVNYITFVISLSMITISIYQQRIAEATNQEKLERIAKYDGLTGLYSYGEFVRLTTNYLLDLENDIHDKIFLFMNIENFKTLNSQSGFAEGNVFLKNFGERLAEIFDGDIIGRQGDDHFVMFTEQSSMMDKVKASRDALKNITHIFMDIKVGGYIPVERDVEVRSEIDKARYASGRIKNKYGKFYLEYDTKMDELFHKRQYVVNNIDKAVEEGWIKAYYQPVVWSNNNKLCGCEALARWIDPVYGFLSPGDFIPVLEESRQIHKLDKAIFEIVCKDLRNAFDYNLPAVPVSINFSRLDFELMDAVEVFEGFVEKYKIPKEYVHVEITESALNDEQGFLDKAIKRFEADGFAIWLDDFGSGYSSLNVLKDYNFDVLKIDMKFLSNFNTNQRAKDIIDCVIRLADSLGMKSLTEGVETLEQANFLKDAGCVRLQGYLFGRPITRDELLKAIKEGKYELSSRQL